MQLTLNSKIGNSSRNYKILHGIFNNMQSAINYIREELNNNDLIPQKLTELYEGCTIYYLHDEKLDDSHTYYIGGGNYLNYQITEYKEGEKYVHYTIQTVIGPF